MKLSVFTFLLIFFCYNLAAQLPATDLYVIDININTKGFFSTGGPLKISTTAAYNNQPYFINSKQLLYVSQNDTAAKTDIFLYDFDKQSSKNLSNTPNTSEYSPKISPQNEVDSNSLSYNVVRVEEDDTTQRLWVFNSVKNTPAVVLENLKNIGYYEWINEQQLLAFLVEEPNQLALINAKSKVSNNLFAQPGRCLQQYGNNGQVYVSKQLKDDSLMLQLYTVSSNTTKNICPLPKNTQDFVVVNERYILAASGAGIMLYAGNGGTRKMPEGVYWFKIADFKQYEIKNISRMAVSPDFKRLVFVAEQSND